MRRESASGPLLTYIMKCLHVLLVLILTSYARCEDPETSDKRSIEDAHEHHQIPTEYVERLNTIQIPKPVEVPTPVHVNVPIRVPHPVPIHVPVNLPVYKPVPVPVESPVPYIVYKPYPVEIIEKVHIPIPKPVPIPHPIVKVKHHFKEIYYPKRDW